MLIFLAFYLCKDNPSDFDNVLLDFTEFFLKFITAFIEEVFDETFKVILATYIG